jgi:hypothetical protein
LSDCVELDEDAVTDVFSGHLDTLDGWCKTLQRDIRLPPGISCSARKPAPNQAHGSQTESARVMQTAVVTPRPTTPLNKTTETSEQNTPVPKWIESRWLLEGPPSLSVSKAEEGTCGYEADALGQRPSPCAAQEAQRGMLPPPARTGMFPFPPPETPPPPPPLISTPPGLPACTGKDVATHFLSCHYVGWGTSGYSELCWGEQVRLLYDVAVPANSAAVRQLSTKALVILPLELLVDLSQSPSLVARWGQQARFTQCFRLPFWEDLGGGAPRFRVGDPVHIWENVNDGQTAVFVHESLPGTTGKPVRVPVSVLRLCDPESIQRTRKVT